MKIGIVGMGSIGSRHSRNAFVLGHDVKSYDPTQPSDFKFEREVYDWADAVVVATPTPWHEGPLRAAIERGKHVLVEKPISIDVGALPELLAVAKRKRLVIMVGNNLRFHACVRKAKTLLRENKLGFPIWANFICAVETDKPTYMTDGAILNSGSHEVDIALHLFGPARVAAASARWGMNTSDEIADFVLIHSNGIRSTFHIDQVTPNRVREFWIAGSEANLHVDLDDRIAEVHGIDLREPSILSGSYDDDYQNEMAAFVSAIGGERTFGATGEEGLATLRLLIEIRTKAALP